MNQEQHIIQQVIGLFLKYGIKSLTMDDIARHLGVSKKTLYKYVSDKNDLVRRVVTLQSELEQQIIAKICERGLNAIDEIFEISRIVAELLGQMHPSVHYDLEKYHPEVWRSTFKHREDFVFNCVLENLNKGKKEGLYREDLNTGVIARLYIAKMDVLFDGEMFPATQFNFREVYLEFFRYHIRGIASHQGLQYLIAKVQQEKNSPTNH
ncbi:MAG: TetR/AcrR family transcriptional regulator [Cryomorphaceae bacterium]|nr:MAG: TetR/AcrR family transcriptional regulator [Cryomorphaceae bacterium]